MKTRPDRRCESGTAYCYRRVKTRMMNWVVSSIGRE